LKVLLVYFLDALLIVLDDLQKGVIILIAVEVKIYVLFFAVNELVYVHGVNQ